jgi:hypothetical protein
LQRLIDQPWLMPLLLIGGMTLALAIPRFNLFNNYVQMLLMYVGINIILATSLNLVNGYMGEFSLAHAGFMAVGAYTSALLTMHVLPPENTCRTLSTGGAGRRRSHFVAGARGGCSVVQGARRLPGHHHACVPDDRQVGAREHRRDRRPSRHPRNSAPDLRSVGICLDGGARLADPEFRLFALRARRAGDPRG